MMKKRRSNVFDLCADILVEIFSYLTLIDISTLNCYLPRISSIIDGYCLELHGGLIKNEYDLGIITNLAYCNRILSINLNINTSIRPTSFRFIRSLTVRQLENLCQLSLFVELPHLKRLVLIDFSSTRVFISSKDIIQIVFKSSPHLKQVEIISMISVMSTNFDHIGLTSNKVNNISKLVLHLSCEWIVLNKLIDYCPQLQSFCASSISSEHDRSLAALGIHLTQLSFLRHVDIAFNQLTRANQILDLVVRTPQLVCLCIRFPQTIKLIENSYLWSQVINHCPKVKRVVIAFWPIVVQRQVLMKNNDKLNAALRYLRRQSEWKHIDWQMD
jgi:hypothetical protein